jgi:saccharopine dehydrogenase (NAD+, L-lysine-forming)
VFKVVFHEEHLVERTDGATFALQDYYDNPADYRSIFGHYAPHLSMILNGIYWTKDYPRLLPRSLLSQLLAKDAQRLLVIGDVSCDIGGSVQATVKATEPDEPVFIYDPARGSHRNGFAGSGVAVMAVDNLPCELPKEATEHFSAALLPFVSRLARTDFSRETDDLNLPAPLRRALILHRGRFTPEFEYMQAFL